MVFPDALYPHLTVPDRVRCGSPRSSRRARDQPADPGEPDAELDDILDRRPTGLYGGQRRRRDGPGAHPGRPGAAARRAAVEPRCRPTGRMSSQIAWLGERQHHDPVRHARPGRGDTLAGCVSRCSTTAPCSRSTPQRLLHHPAENLLMTRYVELPAVDFIPATVYDSVVDLHADRWRTLSGEGREGVRPRAPHRGHASRSACRSPSWPAPTTSTPIGSTCPRLPDYLVEYGRKFVGGGLMCTAGFVGVHGRLVERDGSGFVDARAFHLFSPMTGFNLSRGVG